LAYEDKGGGRKWSQVWIRVEERRELLHSQIPPHHLLLEERSKFKTIGGMKLRYTRNEN
jgi:hypothetical protein